MTLGFLALTAGNAIAAPSGDHPHSSTLWMSTNRGEPGTKFRIDATCDSGGHPIYVISKALSITRAGNTGEWEVNHTARVLDIEPGVYRGELACAYPDRPNGVAASSGFTVLPKTERPEPPKAPAPKPVKAPVKQVVKVPTGAPQTGGGATA